ncbi:MarR family winged helix-turn-helix transcriptional regulator [Rhizobium sp. TRM95796]|uniref:MarR family winged helix-turn-helix transcriptional regulator n=1 Tax=Rhizobium sp. TRM95796 TaxID=2979862 RepID=UPI0021E80F23|nr:MarR family transcriptional regulator [Rhizobium sp. TRM95796]MCV3768937.1 MarR family transcriptional regulator [Rhizobium sp. TRM95796]
MDEKVLRTPGHLVSLAARAFARLSEERLGPLGFGVGHLPVLVALGNGVANTQRDLARFARVEQPPMAQMLARMERDGLITRTRDPRDGRSSRIDLTPAARERLPQASATLFQGNRDAMEGFSDEDERRLVELLDRLIVNLNRLSGAVVAAAAGETDET